MEEVACKLAIVARKTTITINADRDIKKLFPKEKKQSMNKRKKIVLLVSFFIFLDCKTAILIDDSSESNEAETLNKSIGLIGFSGYKEYSVGSGYHFLFLPNYVRKVYTKYPLYFQNNNNKYIPSISDNSFRFINFFKYGKLVQDYSFEDYDVSISQDKMYQIISKYIEKVGLAGLDEMQILFRNEKNTEILLFPNRKIDYYILNINGPPIRSPTTLSKITAIPNLALSLITFGLFPFITQERSYSSLFVYNKNLDMLHEETIDTIYWTITAWWLSNLNNDQHAINTGTLPLDRVIKSNILKLNKKFPDIIKKLEEENAKAKLK